MSRLFHSYQQQARAASSASGFDEKLVMHELNANGSYDTPFVSSLVNNYRSLPEIVAFVAATSALVAPDAALRPRLVRPVALVPDEVSSESMQPPLTFYATPSGAEEERDESKGTSWWNPAEVEEVASRVEFVLDACGAALVPRDICVVSSHVAQVSHISERFQRDARLKDVLVEHVSNVQGASSYLLNIFSYINC